MNNDNTYYGNIHPAYTDKITWLKPPPFLTLLKDLGYGCLATILVMVAITGVFMAIEYFIGPDTDMDAWAAIIIFTLTIFVFVAIALATFKYSVADCPYCAGRIGTDKYLRKKNKDYLLRCENCFEYLINDLEKIRACREEDIKGRWKGFYAPVLNNVWVNECAVCGKSPTQYKDNSTLKIEAAYLIQGSLGVSFGSVKKIPYCDIHVDAISMKMIDEKANLVFPTLSAQRRYLAVNKPKAAANSTNHP